jgi:hypothetical protein
MTKIIRPGLVVAKVLWWVYGPILACASMQSSLLADVPTGSEDKAKKYYTGLAKTLEFSTPEKIFQTKLDDVATYLGYDGLTGEDLQNISPKVLMSPDQLLSPGAGFNVLRRADIFAASQGAVPIRSGDIVATRFFAPKIMNIKDPESTRQLGWRKLVRLRARPSSAAQAHNIAYGIILFNFFTPPHVSLTAATKDSVNTQVMLVTEPKNVPRPNRTGPDTIYWLDYDELSNGGALSLALNASFDANALPQSADGKRSYYVPDGCVACHGDNPKRAMVNYLDTDHWFDRLANDFKDLKADGIPLLVDAETNDTSSPAYKLAFDTIRRFNIEADEQVLAAQPKHDESLAAQKWIQIHESTVGHIPPIDRAIGPSPKWDAKNPDDPNALDAMNQYCFRCHGTVKFSVFNKQKLHTVDLQVKAEKRLSKDAAPEMRMPPDRDLPEDVRALILRGIVP